MAADVIDVRMRCKDDQRLLRQRTNQRTQRRNTEAAIDKNVGMAAGDQEAVGANQAMAMWLGDPEDSSLDLVHCKPRGRDVETHRVYASWGGQEAMIQNG